MKAARNTQWSYWIVALGLGSAFLTTYSPLRAGEPIKVSEPANKIELPKAGSKGAPADKSFEFLKHDKPNAVQVDAPVDARPSTPESPMHQRLKELVDKQRNWIFAKPDDLKKSSAVENLFKLDANKSGSMEKKNPTVLERFFLESEDKNRSSKSKTSTSDSSIELDNKDSMSHASAPFGRDAKKQVDKEFDLNWGTLFNSSETDKDSVSRPSKELLGGLLGRPDSPGHPFLPRVNRASEKTRDQQAQEARAESFKKLLEGRPSAAAASGEPDLINGGIDTTRLPLNPVVGSSWESFNRGSSKGPDSSNPFQGPGIGARTGRSMFGDEFSLRRLGQSDLALPASIPSAPAPVLSRPATFEFPTRKF